MNTDEHVTPISAVQNSDGTVPAERGPASRRATRADQPRGAMGQRPAEVRPTGAGRLSLRANVSWTFVGNVVYTACQWAMIIVIAKLTNPAVVGQFALSLAVAGPIFMLCNLQLRGVQATDARQEYLFGDYLALRLLTTALALLVIAALAVAGHYGAATTIIIMLVGLAKSFEALSDVLYGAMQQHERMDRIAISMSIKGILSLAALAAAVVATRTMVWGSAALAAAWALVLVAYDVPMTARVLARNAQGLAASLRPRWTFRRLAWLAWLAAPLGVVMMLSSFNANVPRYFIAHMQGDRALGIYAALSYLMVAGNTVVSALGQAASPRLARHYARGQRSAFQLLLVKITALGVVLGVGGVVVALVGGRPLVTAFYRPDYARDADVFVLLMAAAGIGYVASLLCYAITAARYFRIQTPLFLATVLATAAGCALLVPTHGLRGAAWAVLGATVVQLAGGLTIVVAILVHKPCGGRAGVTVPRGWRPDRGRT